MAVQQAILFQPYLMGKRGLKPGPTVRCRDEAEAHRRAARVVGAAGVVGAHILRLEVDAEAGDYGEPDCLARFGQTPDDDF